MKYHFCITICGELDTDVTPIPPGEGEPVDPNYGIDIDEGYTPPPRPNQDLPKPEQPVDPGYGVDVDEGYTPPPRPNQDLPGDQPIIDNRPPSTPIIDAGFPTTPPGGRPQWPVDPNYGIDICDPGPQRIQKALAKVVTVKKTRGVRVESFNTAIEVMNARRRKD